MNSNHLKSTNSTQSEIEISPRESSERTIESRIRRFKRSLVARINRHAGDQKLLLRSAINEAERLARNTGLPELFFPTLAMERIRAVKGRNHQPCPC